MLSGEEHEHEHEGESKEWENRSSWDIIRFGAVGSSCAIKLGQAAPNLFR